MTATVMELGLGSQWKNLEPMPVADAITYGNYFDIPGEGIYHFHVRIRLPGRQQIVEATFTHRHFKQ